MTRFSALGDEDGHEERGHASKKPRTSTSDSGQTATNSAPPLPLARPRRLMLYDEESEMESDTDILRFDRVRRSEPDEYEDEEEEEEEEEEEDYEEEDEEEGGGGGGGGVDEEEGGGVEEEEEGGGGGEEGGGGGRGGEEEEEQQDQPSRDAPAPVTVTLTDPDVLDCTICLEPLSPPVYQCENGHISCASCCIKMKNKCGTCSWPIGYNRCRAIEKVLESVKIACKNMQHGCGETINYSKKHDHEKACIYSPCTCPYYLCTHVSMSSSLYSHFATAHSHTCKNFVFNTLFFVVMGVSQQYIFLQEKNENILFILDRTIDSLGSLISVVCVAPTSSKRSFSYELSAKDGTSSIRVKAVAENIPKWVSQPRAKKLFLLPKDFSGSVLMIRMEPVIQSVAK